MSSNKKITLRNTSSKELESECNSSKILKSILGVAPFGINVWNKDMLNILCNDHILEIFDIKDGDEFIERFFEFSPEFQPNGVSSEEMSRINFEKVLKNGKHVFYWMHITPTGIQLPSKITLIKIDNSSEQVFVVGFINDLRADFDYEQNDLEYDFYFADKLPKSRLMYEVKELSEEWYFTIDLRNENITFYGKWWLSLFGENAIFTDSQIIEHKVVKDEDLPIYQGMMNDIQSGVTNTYEFRLLHDSGDYRYHSISTKFIQDKEGNPIFMLAKGIDTHEQRAIEERSQKDLLTDCYNKISAENIISEKLRQENSATHTLFIIDIDNFKAINDNLGHFFGDEVLKDISIGLKEAFRDIDVIARVGGDEFIVFVENLSDVDLIAEKAEKILEVYRKTYSGEYKDYSVSGSVGVALYPCNGKTYEDLYQNADKALNQAKIQGKNRYMLYSDDLNIGTTRSITKIENANRMASSFFDYDLISAVFNILYEKNGDSSSINLTLSYICQKYGADRSYIFETLDGCVTLDNTFEYCKSGIRSEIDNLQGIPYELFADFINKAHNDIIYSNDLRETLEQDEAFKIMDDQGILSFVHAQIKRENQLTFFIGLDDCTKTRIWTEREINSLQYIGKLLSIILQGTHLRDTLNELAKIQTDRFADEHFLMNCVEMLHSGNEPNASIYELLEAVTQYYDAERSYIFEVSECGKYISNTYEYCKTGFEAYKDNLQNLPVEELSVLLNKCKSEGSFHLDINEIDKSSLEFELMEFQNLKDIIIGAVQIEGSDVTGFVGVDNSRKNKDKISIIRTVAKFTATFLDETELVGNLNKLSYYDALTGVKNRHSYGLALKDIDKNIESLGVLYVDILGLSAINDAKGIAFGDSILIKLSEILTSVFRDRVYRVGGDEFVVISQNVSEDDFEKKVALLKDILSKEVDFKTNLGYTWNKNLKSTNKSLETFHVGENYARILRENLEMEIHDGKYIVYMQPQVNMVSGKVESAEALIRRLGANGALQAPIYFLPFYEKEGIVPKIDEFVFETVCKTLKSWKDSGVKNLPTISVNCSRMTVSSKGIVEKFSKTCDSYGIERSNIVIEITETINGIDEYTLANIIKHFSDAGFLVSLDDFGSGYSNLNSLVMADFDELKIDMKIIDGLHEDKKSKALTQVAITLCESLGNITSVAEGVENQLQHDTLCELGCKLGQGYYYAKPMPINEFTAKYMNI